MARVQLLLLLFLLSACGNKGLDLHGVVDFHCRDLRSNYSFALDEVVRINDNGKQDNDTALYDLLKLDKVLDLGSFGELGFCCMCRDDKYNDRVNKYMEEFEKLNSYVYELFMEGPVHIDEEQRNTLRQKFTRMVAIIDSVNKIPLRK
jgi:hypothetical protein